MTASRLFTRLLCLLHLLKVIILFIVIDNLVLERTRGQKKFSLIYIINLVSILLSTRLATQWVYRSNGKRYQYLR